MKVKWQSSLETAFLIVVLFCCVASNANSQCYGSGTVTSSPGTASWEPSPSVGFSVPYQPHLIRTVTTYHGWIGEENAPPAQIYMTISDDAGNICWEGSVPFIYEGVYGGSWRGRATATLNIVLKEGNYILTLDPWQSWSRPPDYHGNNYEIYGMPCGRDTPEECLACL